MIDFTIAEQRKIKRYLGYSENYELENLTDYKYLENTLTAYYEDSFVETINYIVEQLEEVDELMQLNLRNSLAEKVDDITVDYLKFYKTLIWRGNMLLTELASLLGVKIWRNKYVTKSNRYGWRSY